MLMSKRLWALYGEPKIMRLRPTKSKKASRYSPFRYTAIRKPTLLATNLIVEDCGVHAQRQRELQKINQALRFYPPPRHMTKPHRANMHWLPLIPLSLRLTKVQRRTTSSVPAAARKERSSVRRNTAHKSLRVTTTFERQLTPSR